MYKGEYDHWQSFQPVVLGRIMKQLSLREIQLEELNIAKSIDSFCRDKGIKYFLFSGSLLGAVRHKGFIPWDDDMDFYMLRNDYDRFCEEFTHDLYVVKYCENGTAHSPIAKVCNPSILVKSDSLGDEDNSLLWVDIFPLDGVPNSPIKRKILLSRIQNLERMIIWKRKDPQKENNTTRRIIKKIASLYLDRLTDKDVIKIAQKISRISRKIKPLSTGYNANLCYSFIYPDEIFKSRRLYDFEDHQFYSVSDYDTALTSNYNAEYMTPPPENKRGGHYLTAYYNEE